MVFLVVGCVLRFTFSAWAMFARKSEVCVVLVENGESFVFFSAYFWLVAATKKKENEAAGYGPTSRRADRWTAVVQVQFVNVTLLSVCPYLSPETCAAGLIRVNGAQPGTSRGGSDRASKILQ